MMRRRFWIGMVAEMSGARVLVTSRRDEWDKASGVNRISLGLLTRAESVALLKKFLKDLDEGTADQIADVMGDLPLSTWREAIWIITREISLQKSILRSGRARS